MISIVYSAWVPKVYPHTHTHTHVSIHGFFADDMMAKRKLSLSLNDLWYWRGMKIETWWTCFFMFTKKCCKVHSHLKPLMYVSGFWVSGWLVSLRKEEKIVTKIILCVLLHLNLSDNFTHTCRDRPKNLPWKLVLERQMKWMNEFFARKCKKRGKAMAFDVMMIMRMSWELKSWEKFRLTLEEEPVFQEWFQ